ncbi:MAG: molybdopterin molybdotransferase MoeA [Anaerolineales bacterium]
MPEFLHLLPPQAALNLLLENLPHEIESEEVESSAALGRVTVSPVIAQHPLPSFPRSTVDGYAVRAANTHGASESLPAYLNLVGEVPMGGSPDFALSPAECALIHTGGMLPSGADAVVMIEHTQSARKAEVEVLRSVAVGENILKVGEDVAKGQEVIPAGTRLRPAEIGGLMALGVTHVQVARRPRIAILSTGDEVVPPDREIGPGQVRDINSYTLSALVERAGGEPVRYGIISDRAGDLLAAASRALRECDTLVITAGSSASVRDLTSQVINQLGPPGVLVHGVDVRPGKPTILAVCKEQESSRSKPVIGLPGNPVSALVIAGLFIVPVIEKQLGIKQARPEPVVQARLTLNLASQAGREDWVPVRLLPDEAGYQAEPIFGKSNLIFTLGRADGLLRIPPDATGLSAGELVEVILL